MFVFNYIMINDHFVNFAIKKKHLENNKINCKTLFNKKQSKIKFVIHIFEDNNSKSISSNEVKLENSIEC